MEKGDAGGRKDIEEGRRERVAERKQGAGRRKEGSGWRNGRRENWERRIED